MGDDNFVVEYIDVAPIAEEVVVVDPEGGDSAHLNDAKLDDNYGVYLGPPCNQVDIGPDEASGDGQEGGGGGGEVVNDVVYPAEESGSGGLYYNSLSVSNSSVQRHGGSGSGGVVGNDIQLHHRDGTDEMSVAIDLAKLSQGHYTSNDYRHTNNSISLAQPTQYVTTSNGIGALSPVSTTTTSSNSLISRVETPGGSGGGGGGGGGGMVHGTHVRATTSGTGQYVFITEDGREATSLEDLDGRTVEVANKYSKPKMSYAQLICEAILHSKDNQLTLSEIYSEIHRRHPYYLLENRNWQNSIRHNLTLNKCFVKVPRSSNEGRGSYWTMEKGAENIIFRRQSGSRGGGCPAVANRASNQQQQQAGIGLEHSPYSPAPPASSTSATLAAAGGGQIIESVQTDTSQIVQDATVVGSQGNIVYVTVPSPI